MSDLQKELHEQLNRLFDEFKKENDAGLKAGVRDVLREEKLDKINAAMTAVEEKAEAVSKALTMERQDREELERKVNMLRLNGKDPDEDLGKNLATFNHEVKALARERGIAEPADVSVEHYQAYKSAWQKWARKGADALDADELKAMRVGNDADGGFLVTPDVTGRMVQKIYELSPIRQISAVQAIGSDALEGIEDLGDASVGWVGEEGTRSDSTTPQVGKWRIEAMEIYTMPKATQKLLDDSSVDIEAWLAAKTADKFAREEGKQFINGTGVGMPRGFTTYTTAATADASRSWGQLEHVKTTANGDFAASNPADYLIDLTMAFRPGYLMGATWVTRRTVIAKIRKFKEATTNAYMWQPGLTAGQPSQLLGYPVVVAEDMPALGTGSLSMALGNFMIGYQIVDRLGVRVLRDPFTAKPYVVFYTTKRVGGAVINFEAIKFMNFSA